MHKKTLREVSKFASGLIFADFFCGLWFYFGDLLPVKFLGINLNAQQVFIWLLVDVIIFTLLVRYAWGQKK